MKYIFSSLLILVSFPSLAFQPIDSLHQIKPQNYRIKKNSIVITSDFYYASNAVTNELLKTYYLNGFITDEMKDDVSKNLSDKNRLGGDFSTEFYYSYKPDSMFGCDNTGWFIGLKNINHLNAGFTRDLFEVYFRGNKNYEGKKADFSDLNYMSLQYQQLQFGLSKKIRKDSATYEAHAAFGFNMGQQLLRIKTSKSDLYTADIGEYLDVNVAVEIHNSDSLHKKLGSFNGFGFSTDLFFSAAIKNKHFFSVSVSNLGFIRWNNQSTELKVDSSFRFNGVDVSTLLDFSDTVVSTISIDSTLKQPFLSKRKYNSYTLFLPAKIEVQYMCKTKNQNLDAGIGVNYMLNADYFPEVYVQADYKRNHNRVVLKVSYGGYTTFGTGIFYSHYFNKGYLLSLGSNYLNSVFNLDKSISEGARVTISRIF